MCCRSLTDGLFESIAERLCTTLHAFEIVRGRPDHVLQTRIRVLNSLRRFYNARSQRQRIIRAVECVLRLGIGVPVFLHVPQVRGVPHRHGPLIRCIFHLIQPRPHDGSLVLHQTRKVYQHVPRVHIRLVLYQALLQLERVIPMQRLVGDGVSKLGSGERLKHCALIGPLDGDLWSQGWYGLGIRKHFDGPFVYAQEEDAGVEAVPVLRSDEVDVGEGGWWEEDCPGDFGVQDDGVGVEPAVQVGISIVHPLVPFHHKSSRTGLPTRSNPPAAHKA